MTVTAAEARIEYSGNGATKIFAYPYQFFQNDDLDVWLFNDATGIGVDQILGADYTVTGAMNPSGGNITMTVSPPGGTTLIIINNPDIVQTTHYVNADDFPADSHEQGLDRLTKICQRLSDRVDRAVRAPDYAPEDQVPDAESLVTLVEQANQSAADAAASASDADNSEAGAASSVSLAANSANAAAASATASANSATTSQTYASQSAASAAAAQVAEVQWQGNWSASTNYNANDAVAYAGSSWIAKSGNINKQPDTNPAIWDVLAAKGAPGSSGPGGGDMLKANNLSDVVSTTQSRLNLGLGNSATLNVGTTSNTVAAGNDPRFVGVVAAISAPAGAPDGTLWWETDTGLLYFLYNDGNTTQWVIVCPQPDTSAFLFKTGDTMTGPLTVVTPPTAPGHAASKAYVDATAPPPPASAAEYVANSQPAKYLTSGAIWGAAGALPITDGASVQPDCSLGIDFYWLIGGTGRTLQNPLNAKPGQKGIIVIQQDGTGGKSIGTWGNAYKFPNGVKPVLSNAANLVDIISYVVYSPTFIACTFAPGFA
jgi:hypothetical protein